MSPPAAPRDQCCTLLPTPRPGVQGPEQRGNKVGAERSSPEAAGVFLNSLVRQRWCLLGAGPTAPQPLPATLPGSRELVRRKRPPLPKEGERVSSTFKGAGELELSLCREHKLRTRTWLRIASKGL